MRHQRRFPASFQWGAATAAYQIEGAHDADGKGLSIWDTFSHTPGAVLHGDHGDTACDSYHRYGEDLDVLEELGLGHYRFSISWPRIFPDGQGRINQAGLDHYRRFAEACLARGIVPAATLYHWDLPQALQDAGGWPGRDTALRFADYAVATHEALKDLIPRWITLNEPACSALLGYGIGVHAPGHRDTGQALRAAHHLMLGHGLALRGMREGAPEGNEYGVTLNFTHTTPVTSGEADTAAARRTDLLWNDLFSSPALVGELPAELVEWFTRQQGPDAFSHVRDGDLEAIAQPLDFLGVNYYFGTQVEARPEAEAGHAVVVPDVGAREVPITGVERTAMDWPIEPEKFTEVLLWLRDAYPGLPPVFITENGAAFHDYPNPEGKVVDPEREAFVRGYLNALLDAMDRGVDVRGYYYWSLLDNFEWALGYARRFGLTYVDYPTGRRTIKESARWFARVAATGELD